MPVSPSNGGHQPIGTSRELLMGLMLEQAAHAPPARARIWLVSYGGRFTAKA